MRDKETGARFCTRTCAIEAGAAIRSLEGPGAKKQRVGGPVITVYDENFREIRRFTGRNARKQAGLYFKDHPTFADRVAVNNRTLMGWDEW